MIDREELIAAERTLEVIDLLSFLSALFAVHKHKCDNCGRVWEHARANNPTDAEYKAAHTCNVCGQEQSWKFHEEGTP